jgi:tripartite-type tricarboxylate transporter receptor subunit TctC
MQYANFTEAFSVRADSRWKVFKDFIAEARKNPGKLTYATAGPMSSQHIVVERIALAENVKLSHVPTGGGTEVIAQLLGGHVNSALSAALSRYLGSDKIRALGVLGEKRFHLIPGVPTFSELGYKLDAPLWLGLIAPRGLDPQILKKLHGAFKKASDDPSFQEYLAKLYMTPLYRDAESFRKKVFKDFDMQAEVAKKLGLIK